MKKQFQISDEVLLQNLDDGEAVLLNLKTERYHGLDEVSLRFWELMQKTSEVKNVVEQALEIFEVDEKTLSKDFDLFLEECEKAEILQRT